MADELVEYPTGQIQIGPGDLQHAASAKASFKNNAKLVHTLRRTPSGIVIGVRDCSGSIETLVPADGPEVDYLRAVRTGKKIQFRFKVPADNITINGVFETLDLEVPLGDTVKMNLQFIGKAVDSP